ncbi:tryptophan halogenase family protein [Alteromonas lipotrueiana]|uniref:tryptophan halogenase family protein n=1 Tax=Alteromonas lipotrueiana TaxID=2803815 RepID=UPI001C47E0CF|nr:tryptophan halogenase family protein [Alteromonas lipotrueiana]
MEPLNRIVVVGGGTAGWLTAGLLAASHQATSKSGRSLEVCVIESEKTLPIGVGEGTWPSMRQTLQRIGISESQIIRYAGATFKQASKFVNWHQSSARNSYYHPFSAPQNSASFDISGYWLNSVDWKHYADDVSVVPWLCEQNLAPRANANFQVPPASNYGYHLDAGQFVELLKKHCIESLGVEHIIDTVVNVDTHDGHITSLNTSLQQTITADLYIDCSGFTGLLIDKALGVELVSCNDIMLADTALVAQQAYGDPDCPIACYTKSTAQEAGWIWDIGLQQRRGAGYVYASEFCSNNQAQDTLTAYLQQTGDPVNTNFRQITFKTGYRQKFWSKNCVAIGLSSGFLEPLEASSLMLIEQSALWLADNMPGYIPHMTQTAKRFNDFMHANWQAAIMFLKLHYVLSDRNEPFWKANRAPDTIPDLLIELLDWWQYNPIGEHDIPFNTEVFTAHSYRYILYGMKSQVSLEQYRRKLTQFDRAAQVIAANEKQKDHLSQRLPSHRYLLDEIIHQCAK